MNEFEKNLLKYLSEKNLKKIQSVKIGIAGSGGLGSNCANYLVRTGFKNFMIADFDKVEYSNLNRQFYFLNQIGENKVTALKENLLKINPDLNIQTCSEKLNKNNIQEVFSGCDVIVEAFDKAEYKSMIAETFLSKNKLIVSASGLAGFGNTDKIKVNRIKENFILIGDLETSVEDNSPLAPRVNVAAAMQADIVLEYVLKGRNEEIK